MDRLKQQSGWWRGTSDIFESVNIPLELEGMDLMDLSKDGGVKE